MIYTTIILKIIKEEPKENLQLFIVGLFNQQDYKFKEITEERKKMAYILESLKEAKSIETDVHNKELLEKLIQFILLKGDNTVPTLLH